MRRGGYGISVEVPSGWASAIVRRPAPSAEVLRPEDGTAPPGAAPRLRPQGGPSGGGGALVERTLPVLHVSSRPLPASVGDFGAGLVEAMRGDDVFVALLEYGSDLAGTGLFARVGMPRLAPSQFDPGRMPRHLPGRSASQHFFSLGGRAFCLYTVVGSHARRMASVPRAAGVVRSLALESASALRARGVSV